MSARLLADVVESARVVQVANLGAAVLPVPAVLPPLHPLGEILGREGLAELERGTKKEDKRAREEISKTRSKPKISMEERERER